MQLCKNCSNYSTKVEEERFTYDKGSLHSVNYKTYKQEFCKLDDKKDLPRYQRECPLLKTCLEQLPSFCKECGKVLECHFIDFLNFSLNAANIEECRQEGRQKTAERSTLRYL